MNKHRLSDNNSKNSSQKTHLHYSKLLFDLNSGQQCNMEYSNIDMSLLLDNEEDFEIFKNIITNENIVFNSHFILNSFDALSLKDYCDNFELKIHLTLADDPDVKLPEEIIKLIGKCSSTQLALKRFFGFENNLKALKELYQNIIRDLENMGLGYFKFTDKKNNLLGGGALILMEDDDKQNKKVDLAIHILNQHQGIGDVCLKKLFNKAFADYNITEIYSQAAKEDLEVTNFMCKHGMIIRDDEESGDQFYFIDKKMWEGVKNY
jgi:hypothetical protein